MQVTVLDLGTGNLSVLRRRLERAGSAVRITARADEVRAADRLVLPGVGHFRTAMETLRRLGLEEALAEAALVRRVPTLGICLGMQLMTTRSEEGGCGGLGWFDAEVVRFRVADRARHKVPHTGWNTVTFRDGHPLARGVPAEAGFYFVHAYHASGAPEAQVLGTTDYAYAFPSALARDNLVGVQFHPEKSHDAGLRLLANFLEMKRCSARG